MPSYEPPPLEEEIREYLASPVEPDPPAEVDEGVLVDAVVHELDDDFLYLKFGDEQFGRCPIDDATPPGGDGLPQVGAKVRVLLDEERDAGTWEVSIAKAVLIDAFDAVRRWKRDKVRVRGRVNLVVRGGFAVEAHGLRCFLPGRESGIPRRLAFEAIGHEFDFDVIRFDKRDAQPVLSRRAIAAAERKEAEKERLASLEVGEVIEGVVSSIRPFGAFVDLGGVDGLCHVSELSLQHIDDPREVVSVGEMLTVKITDIDRDKGRVGLSRRDLLGAEQRERVAGLEVGALVRGRVTRLAEFGAFIELEPGMEGLLHVSELSWTERHAHPSEVLAEGDEPEIRIIGVDPANGRISLSLRAATANPWQEAAEAMPPGTIVEGEITRIEDYGLFVRVAEGVEGLCHISDLVWEGRPDTPADAGDFAVGDTIQVRVLAIDPEKARIKLGVKQVSGDPWDDAGDRVTVGTVFAAPVVRFDERAAYVQVAEGLEGRLHISQISDERVDSIRAALRVGQEVEVMTTAADRDRRRLDVSIRAVKEKLEAETPKSFQDDDAAMNPLAAALQRSGLTDDGADSTDDGADSADGEVDSTDDGADSADGEVDSTDDER